jgi:predicted permease
VDGFKPIAAVIPVFLLVGAGFAFANYKRISLAPVTEIIVYLATPCLVFTSLASRPLFLADITILFLGACGMIGGVGILVRVYFALFKFYSRGFVLPAIFMNSGNIGIPLALFALGEPGLQRATLLFVIISLFQNTLGIYIVSRRRDWREIFRLPLIYVTVLGLAFNLGRIPIPDVIFEPLRMLGHSTIPLMLVSLGYRLRDLRTMTWGHSLGGAMLRMLGGLATGYAVVALLDAEGVNRQLILLYSCLPSAVINFILTEKYQEDPDLAASIILLTTVFSVVAIPAVLWLIL